MLWGDVDFMENRIEFIFDKVAKDVASRTKDIASMENALEDCGLTGKTILEVGCGMGDNLIYCARKGALYAEGFDISGESIKLARDKAAYLANVFFHKCGLEEYTTERRFNIILALGVFEYFEDPFQSLKKITSFLVKDGTLVLLISKPIFIKKVSFLCRLILSKIPLKFILPAAKLLAKILKILNMKFKKILYYGGNSTYTLEQTILEGLMVPRFNVFHHGTFCKYLDKEGFSVRFFNGMAPSMICLIAKRGISCKNIDRGELC